MASVETELKPFPQIAYVIFESEHGTINTKENRDVRVLGLEGTDTPPTSFQVSSSPNIPGEVVVNSQCDARHIDIEMTAPQEMRERMIRMFGTGRKGRLVVNWGPNTRFIDYVVRSSSVVQETVTRNLKIFLTLCCPDVYFNGMSDFGENIAARAPLIAFPNLWYLGDDLVTDYNLFDSGVALENVGDVPIGVRFTIKATHGAVLNPTVYTSDDVFVKVFVHMQQNDVLDISTIRRDKHVRLNGESILNHTDVSSTFFEVEPGSHTLFYKAEDGMENMDVFLFRRPQYLGV